MKSIKVTKISLIAILLIMVLITIVFICAGCANLSLPIFERLDENGVEDEDGIVIVIDDVIYKMFPETRWSPSIHGEVIGYAGNRKTTVSVYEGDTERNFVSLHDSGSSMNYIPLYRTDILIPEPSKSSVNKLIYSETDFSGESAQNYGNTIIERKIIHELFDVLESGTRTRDISFIEDFSLSISCFSDEVPGASYNLNIVKSDGKLMCGTNKEGYVEIPIELLEKIAGKEIDLEELLAELDTERNSQ